MMTNEAVRIEEMDAGEGKIVLATRFGELTFEAAQAIHIPRGVMGFPGMYNFALAKIPNPALDQFTVLQCLDDADLSFLVLPVDLDGGIIDRKDAEDTGEALGIAPANLVVLVIVSIREAGGRPQISVNLRAPILLDAQSRTGAQHVLADSKYAVRHVLSPRPQDGEPG